MATGSDSTGPNLLWLLFYHERYMVPDTVPQEILEGIYPTFNGSGYYIISLGFGYRGIYLEAGFSNCDSL